MDRPCCTSVWTKSYMTGDSIKCFHLCGWDFSVLRSDRAGVDGAVGAADASNGSTESVAIFFFSCQAASYTICEKLPRYCTSLSGLIIMMIWLIWLRNKSAIKRCKIRECIFILAKSFSTCFHQLCPHYFQWKAIKWKWKKNCTHLEWFAGLLSSFYFDLTFANFSNAIFL